VIPVRALCDRFRSKFAAPHAAAVLLACLIVSGAARADDDIPYVPPGDEIEVLDPRVDPEGKPRAVIRQGADGSRCVDVPPAIIVHRYYYTGDREFQGPFLPGGPTIIVVRHPATSQQLYVEASMLPGAPRVTYKRTHIEYNYGKRSMILHFGHLAPLCDEEPKIYIHENDGLIRTAGHCANETGTHVGEWVERTGLPYVVHHVASSTGEALDTTADHIHHAGAVVATPFLQVWEALPWRSYLESTPEERAQRLRDIRVQSAQPLPQGLEGTIPTLP
jgi:hypothetical protein